MPVYALDEDIAFPPPHLANEDGLLAVGGDLSVQRLVLAYSIGIFPWPSPGFPLLWFSPNPRLVLYPQELRIGRSLRKRIRKQPYEIRFDTSFREVVERCAEAYRPGQHGTWITDEMVGAYVDLHEAGLAHSAEAYLDGQLVGGLYGVSLGRVFCGESMFATQPDASKIAFVTLIAQLKRWGCQLVDCQVHTDHLARFGAREVPRGVFLEQLSGVVRGPTRQGRWKLELDPADVLAAAEEI